ncbi:MAG: hypothetical protein OET46_11795, partial [Xanthomonadales bacterium]|nr:hypothetical protein [Xanthomonadales bacterium]
SISGCNSEAKLVAYLTSSAGYGDSNGTFHVLLLRIIQICTILADYEHKPPVSIVNILLFTQ